MVWHEDEGTTLDAPRSQLGEEIHSEDVKFAENRRYDDIQVLGAYVPNAEFLDGACSSLSKPVCRSENDGDQVSVPVDRSGIRRPFGYRSDGGATVDEHSPLHAVDGDIRPKMAVGRHPNSDLIANDLLTIEPKATTEARKNGIVRGLLDQEENKEGEQPKREGEPEDRTDIGRPLEEHEHQRCSYRVERIVLPLWGRRSWHLFCVRACDCSTKRQGFRSRTQG